MFRLLLIHAKKELICEKVSTAYEILIFTEPRQEDTRKSKSVRLNYGSEIINSLKNIDPSILPQVQRQWMD